jgi:hypothetical protein
LRKLNRDEENITNAADRQALRPANLWFLRRYNVFGCLPPFES